MNRLYSISGFESIPKVSNQFYNTLGDAKGSIRKGIKSINKRRNKENKLHFEDYEIIEYELVEKDRHRL